MKNSIFIGNGLNLLSGAKDWNTLLSNLGDTPLLKDIPNTLQYESIMVQKDYNTEAMLVNDQGHVIINADSRAITVTANTESLIKNDIAEALKTITYNHCHTKFADMPFEHYITSNYDDAVNKSLMARGYVLSSSNSTEKIYSIRRRYEYENGTSAKIVWKLHGDINHPSSIMLGLDHYCGSVGKIDNYLKGHYSYGKEFVLPDIISRLDADPFEIHSWIDLFFTTDVHIIGFGLDYSEIDLWWLLNRRKRYIRKYGRNIINNNIIFYGEVDDSKRQLLENLEVHVEIFLPNGNYPEMYDRMIERMRSKVSEE